MSLNLKSGLNLLLLPLSLPLSYLYGLVVFIRNSLYNLGVLRSIHFDIPVICVGNITVGGTGKTPHVEYLIRMLDRGDRTVAVLSRGYGRKTKNFRYVQSNDTVEQVGDESLQLKRKFPNVVVAVDVKRELAIPRLCSDNPNLRVILLDDAFQYRKVRPGLSLVLVDYGRPVWRDWLLPLGRLRDSCIQLLRADTVIISKCPESLSTDERATIEKRLKVQGFQHIYYTGLTYASPIALFPQLSVQAPGAQARIVSLTGIANPLPFIAKLKEDYDLVDTITFSDHHNFSAGDIDKIEQLLSNADYLITTEKDSVRLIQHAQKLSDKSKAKIFYMPIAVKVLSDEEHLIEDIEEYVNNK